MAEILVLDDIQDAAQLVRKILERRGHTVHAFTEEQEALEFARKNKVELAILDIKLKKMSGIQVLRQLKEIDASIKALMLTGYPTIDTAREALDLGASEYCVKPIDKDELEKKVDTTLGLEGSGE